MRDPERIGGVLAEVERVWRHLPDWRFAQLIVNFISWYGRDPFYLEDDTFVQKLNQFLAEQDHPDKTVWSTENGCALFRDGGFR